MITYERKDNAYIITDQYQSFIVNGEEVAELVKVVDQIKFNFFFGGRNVQKEIIGWLD